MYILGLLVVIVWGLIIYRIYQSVDSRGQDDIPAAPGKAAKEVYNDYEIPKDTTRLLLNYRDPFSDSAEADTVVLHKPKRVITVVPKVPPAVNWGFVKYAGFVSNPVTKKLIAIVRINGKNVMLSEGESNQNVKLLKNMRDSIKIYFEGKTKFINIHASL